MAHLGTGILQFMEMTEHEFLNMLAYLMLGTAFVVFVGLQVLKAPYGRYVDTMSLGFIMDSKVAWFLQELPSFSIPVYLATFTSISDSSIVGKVLVGGFLLHYLQRTFIYPFIIRGSKGTPVIVTLFAFIFCCYNGYLQGAYLLHVNPYQNSWLTDPRFISGSLLFFSGLLINLHSDHILRNLRKPGETCYKMPQGGFFDYISGANFFGEIVEWTGFAVACWSLPGLAFCVFTICNIGHRAVHHHRWYQQKFEDYPKCRKALVPFLL